MVSFNEVVFDRDLAAVLLAPASARWAIEKLGPLEVGISMPSARCDEVFLPRLRWSAYPTEPPSLKFRDEQGRIDQPSAWPMGRGFRPKSLDTCANWCAEGFALHPEWRTDPEKRWEPRGNALLLVLNILQDELDNHVQGRFKR